MYNLKKKFSQILTIKVIYNRLKTKAKYEKLVAESISIDQH